jgi:chorismate mutase/prephenate dehydratase
LLGLKGSSLTYIKNIYSHPQALAQCKHFLASHSAGATEHADTALAAEKISQDRNPSNAAIASAEAGRLYGLTILARDIADKPNNKTRFVILERKKP